MLAKNSFYVPLEKVIPGQARYSTYNVQAKIDKALQKKYARLSNSGKYILSYDAGASALPRKSALPVIAAPAGKYILIDGHHDYLALKMLGAKTIPIYVHTDLQNTPTNQVWDSAEKAGLVYPYMRNNQRKITMRWEDLEDDPLRYFVALTALKYNQGKLTQEPKFPLWVKHDKGTPFIEFKMADILRANGFVYTYDTPITTDLVKKAYEILKKNPSPSVELYE